MKKKNNINTFIKTNWKIILIILLIILIFVFSTIIGSNMDKETKTSSFDVEETKDNAVYCQREYFYNNNDTYLISICGNELFINKNRTENKTLDIQNAKYLYKFLDIKEYYFYILTTDGDVYLLSQDEIVNEQYNLEKLGFTNIIDIKEFYKGISKESAYNQGIYAIDKDNKMHLIK